MNFNFEKLPHNPIELRKEELRNLIKLKKESAPIESDQYDELKEEMEQYQESIDNKGEASLLDFERKRYEKIKEILQSITIHIETISELKFALEELGLSEDSVRENLIHENAHANTAEQYGANHTGYNIIILKNGNIYQTRVSFPDSLSDQEVNFITEKALEAPEKYENSGELSEDDKKQLERLKYE